MSDPNSDFRCRPLLVVAAAVVVLAVALRFYQLDGRPVHFDEGVHAYYAWKFAVEGEFTYDPWRHGPLLYYMTAPLMRLGDESVVAGRAAVAAVSLVVFPALYLLRRDLPRSTLLFAAAVLAVHPYALRTARFYRNDALLGVLGLLLIGLYATYRRNPSRPVAVGLGATLGLVFATKEAAFLVVPAIVLPVLTVAHFDGRFTGRGLDQLLARYAPPRYAPAAVAAAVLVVVALYSNWPPDPTAFDGLLDGLRYWLDRSGDGSGEVTYYVDRLVGATPGLGLLAAVGTVGTVLRTDSSWLRWIFLSWGAVVTAVLSLIADQSSYNLILVFPPVVMLAGCGVHDAVLALRYASRRVGTPSGGPNPGTVPETARVLAPVVFALLLVTAGISLPNLTADTDDLGEQDVDGITTTNQDTRKQVFVHARDRAEATGCPVLIGPDEYGWPGPWWLRDVAFDRVREWDDSYDRAVVVNRGPIESLETRSYRRTRPGQDGRYYVYVPEAGCTGQRAATGVTSR